MMVGGEPQDRVLQFLQVNVRDVLGEFAAHNALFSWRDDQFGGLVSQLSTFVLSEPLESYEVSDVASLIVEFPGSTWQMFKSCHAGRWWLGWFVSRFPVRVQKREQSATLTCVFRTSAVFPHADVVADARLGQPYYRVVTGSPGLIYRSVS